MQREAVKYRLKKLAARQSEIAKKSAVIRESIIRKYQEIQVVLDEDLRMTLSHLEMEERAAVSALDGLMEKNCSLIQDIEQDMARITVAMDQTDTEPDTMSFFLYSEQEDMETVDRVMDLLNRTDPSSVNLDEVKADQILSLTSNMLLLISSQTPIIKKLTKSCCQICVSRFQRGDSATYTDTWQQLPDLPGRFDTTLNVISLQGLSFGRHYWEIDVTGKTYWELGVTYPNIPRKGTTEDCWLGRGHESWCVEFFDGEYTAWHGGLVTFLEADNMTALFSFCAGTFSDCLHLALCPGHDHNGTNAEPVVICNATSPSSDL
ncbi:Zinc-binding protein A33 [Liparis tanakae]|uniref:Zinc-binding protein A33 n=1 Tax=Liparis tanakae TaxID=230148 RepID=A0A4Z2H8G4_9TELE|nr:Zinc-binding protein A33 [Liparis tanakae]